MRTVLMLCLVGVLAAAVWGADPMAAAQAFRKGQPVVPAPDGTYFCEAEEFKVMTPGWKALPFGENDHAATMAITFLSRKGFLGAPAQCAETVAETPVHIAEAGNYLVLARYEAALHFETRFRVQIDQDGKTVFDRLYGARSNVKVWSTGTGLVAEPGPTARRVNQSTVWEGHDAFAALQPGPATLRLIAGPQPEDATRRNIDLIMLTRDEAQVKMRIAKEGYLPLDGWLTQAGDVYLRVQNSGAQPATVSSLKFQSGPFKEHSPYWVHIRNWKPVKIDVPADGTSDWVEVGGTMDALNDGQWGFAASAPCSLTFGLKEADGRITPLRTFTEVTGTLELVGLADVRYTRRIPTPAELNKEIFDYLHKLPKGKAPSQTLVIAYGGWNAQDWEALSALYGLNGYYVKGPKGYVDWRDESPAQLEARCQKLTPAERENIAIVSLGDEIGLPAPTGTAATEGFIAFLKAQKLTPAQVDPAAGDDWTKVVWSTDAALKATNPSRYYWSMRYQYHYGIQRMKALTDVLRKYLPNAGIGANYSPHGGVKNAFLGRVHQWVTCFREEGMTQPWSEDYTWQLPLGSQQMNGLAPDLLRAGMRGHPEWKLHYYVMPHMPGNNPESFRRMFLSAVGHGAKILNLFEFNPVWLSYTENHVNGNSMYGEVLTSLRELAKYEDIIQAGEVRPAQTALWFSETADIWDDYANSGGAAKRALYIAILHNQVPLDLVVEQDALDGTLDQYKVLYLTDRHVSRAAAAALTTWVKRGGKLFATAGAGMLDEYNQPNSTMRALLGVNETEFVAPAKATVGYIRQDLPFVPSLETVTYRLSHYKVSASAPVFGAISKIGLFPDAAVLGTFGDRSPAMVGHAVGKGQTVYCAFLPGLSYFKPAIPKRPLDLTTREDSMSHLLAVNFDEAMRDLIGQPLLGDTRPVSSFLPLVETTVIESKHGTVITLNNWNGQPVKGFTLTVNIPVPHQSATLASGGKVNVKREDGQTRYTFDLSKTGDVLILR